MTVVNMDEIPLKIPASRLIAPQIKAQTFFSWRTFYVMFLREIVRMKQEPSRLLGIVVQPLIFWFVIGSGFVPSFRVEGSESLDYLSFFYPGILAMVILFTAIFSTITLIEDRQSGFLQAVLVGPGSRISLTLGKIIGISFISLIQALLFFAIAPIAGIDLSQAQWPSTLLVIFLGATGLSALGFIFAWSTGSSAAYHAIMSMILIPLWIMSGAMFPPSVPWIETIVNLNPIAWLVSCLRATLAGGQAPVGTVTNFMSFGVSLTLLFGFAIVASGVAAAVCSRRR